MQGSDRIVETQGVGNLPEHARTEGTAYQCCYQRAYNGTQVHGVWDWRADAGRGFKYLVRMVSSVDNNVPAMRHNLNRNGVTVAYMRPKLKLSSSYVAHSAAVRENLALSHIDFIGRK